MRAKLGSVGGSSSIMQARASGLLEKHLCSAQGVQIVPEVMSARVAKLVEEQSGAVLADLGVVIITRGDWNGKVRIDLRSHCISICVWACLCACEDAIMNDILSQDRLSEIRRVEREHKFDAERPQRCPRPQFRLLSGQRIDPFRCF